MSDSDTGRASRLVVAAAVLDNLEHPTTLLCAARSYPPEHAGQFELPGGKVEPAERPEQALARELDEEIGLGVRLGPELVVPRQLAVAAPPNSSPGDDAPAWPAMHGFRMRVWLAEPADPAHGPQRGASHERLRWVGLAETDALPWLSADLPVLASIRAVHHFHDADRSFVTS